MIEDLVSISTLMMCTFLSTTVVGIFLLQVWLTDRRHAAAGYWCLSMWVGSLCTLLFTFRAFGYPLVTVGLANMLAVFGYAMMWAGFRVFDNRPVHGVVVLSGAVLWLVAYLGVNAVAQDVNNRVIIISLLITAYSVATGVDIWRGRRTDPLPTRFLAALFFVSHGIIYFLRVPMTLLAPSAFGHGTAYSAWFAIFSLELFAHTILAAVAMLVLIKERGEAMYRQASRTDALTGIANRRSFLDDVQARLARRSGGSLLVFDLDRFKSINDTYGHAAGDAVLKRFVETVSARMERGMLFCRFGGEEFALFAPHHGMDRAEVFAQSLRREIAALSLDHGEGRAISLSVSIGLADVETFGADFDRLYSAADRALYVAKDEGRDRVKRAEPSAGLSDLASRLRASIVPDAGAAAAG